MSKPATDMRLARAAEGFTEVIGRGNAHITTRNPTTKKCAYDGQVGVCVSGWLNSQPLIIFLGVI